MFLAAAAARPDSPAVGLRGQAITYAEMERRVRGFAGQFACGKGPGVLVALPQGPNAYAAILGAGLAGCYYAPVNVEVPVDKLRRIARILQPDMIVADPVLFAALAADVPGAAMVGPDDWSDAEGPLTGTGRRHDIAYVIFTSGSTGLPKGVMIGREALNHYVDWVRTSGMIKAGDRVSQFPNIAFDVSVTEIYGGFGAGATLYPLVGAADRTFPGRVVAREKLTVWNSTPSVISMIARAGDATFERLGSLRLLNLYGEALLPSHLTTIFAAVPDAVVLNTYGPTEATVTITELRVDRTNFREACAATVSIGGAIERMGLHLIGGPIPDQGAPAEGEIVITGPQLASGYWNDPEKTAASFRTITIDGAPVRAYFTGDWAERRGRHVFFKERIDMQVKIHGFRLELDEVAHAIHEAGFPVACVLKWKDELAAVIEHDPAHPFDEAALRDALAKKLEKHAVPSIIRLIDRMPHNQNDKLDRKAVAEWLASTEARGQ